jgi:hypothetical protein
MVKSKLVLPLVAAGSLGLAQVVGPHEPHVEINLQEQGPQLVGMLATTVVSTATANVQMIPSSFMWRDF